MKNIREMHPRISQKAMEQLADRLTPLQKDIMTLAAAPIIFGWQDRWYPASARLNAMADGLIRRGLLYKTGAGIQSFEVTHIGFQVAKLLIDREENMFCEPAFGDPFESKRPKK